MCRAALRSLTCSSILLGLVALVVGCGGDPANDPVAFASYIKSRTVRNLTIAQNQRGVAVENINKVIDDLSRLAASPVGDHLETYQQLLESCLQLKALYEDNADDEQIIPKIESTISLARTLPGSESKLD